MRDVPEDLAVRQEDAAQETGVFEAFYPDFTLERYGGITVPLSMHTIVLIFDPEDADEDDPHDLARIECLAKDLNLEMARISSAYQGYRIEPGD